ncbi:RNA polymerase I associated factor, A49-like protein [Dendrothele bispora CBS 962.96]|uniref:RNA polymerase I associated factor, A49-like protein n=1 Tax=Dendrothele bispora (strain CBS 962.96) TaxID=1314807 RepID=A0A4S8LVD7_DENBC|nr:RNA polymerase I associated factor, A49-like protein [Dendrothele bispora CBS 962.96]
MSPASTPTNKRKRNDDGEKEISLRLGSSSSGIAPMLVSFPALEAPESTPFKLYARKKSKTKEKDGDSAKFERMLVVGETPAVEFLTNEEETNNVARSGSRYLLAVHNRRTGSVVLLPEAKAPHVLSRTVKNLKAIPPAPAPSAAAYREARTALGETFGTKKAQAAIRAQERNRVDVDAMKGAIPFVMDGIDKGAEGLLTKEEAKEFADANRLIPPFSLDATDPSDIYSLHDVIPETEWKAINVTPFDEAKEFKERRDLLPYRHSKWLNDHLYHTYQGEMKHKKRKIKLLYYISTLMDFRLIRFGKDGIEKDRISDKLKGVPNIIVDGLISRFTETTRGSTACHITSATETKLLAYLLALCLRVDGFTSNPNVLGQDLNLALTQVNQIFKSLGCKYKALSERDRVKLGLSETLANLKMQVLTAPVEFPRVRTGKKNTGR